MKIVILGDISVERPVSIPPLPFLESADFVIANLEGPIQSPESLFRPNVSNPVFSTSGVLDVLRGLRVSGVTLANNHILDIRGGLSQTCDTLDRERIAWVGAGINIDLAERPLVIDRGGTRLVVCAFGWPVIGCGSADAMSEGVQPLEPGRLFQSARRIQREFSGARILFLVHWNYEFERDPQPAHRQLALDLLAAGVDAVVGHHPHIPGGAEMVGGRLAAYSIGNWVFTRPLAASVPPLQLYEASISLALELSFETGQVVPTFHYCRWDSVANSLTYVASEAGLGSQVIARTPYSGLGAAEYRRWFKSHRRRRTLLPVYRDYRAVRRNRAYDWLLRVRHACVARLRRGAN